MDQWSGLTALMAIGLYVCASSGCRDRRVAYWGRPVRRGRCGVPRKGALGGLGALVAVRCAARDQSRPAHGGRLGGHHAFERHPGCAGAGAGSRHCRIFRRYLQGDAQGLADQRRHAAFWVGCWLRYRCCWPDHWVGVVDCRLGGGGRFACSPGFCFYGIGMVALLAKP